MTRTIQACPECEETRIYYRSGGGMQVDTEPDWICRNCGATFDAPVERESVGHGAAGGSATVAALSKASPEEVSGR